MKHLLLLAALVFGSQPVIADLGAPNGATVIAIVLALFWMRLTVRAQHNS